MELSFVLEPKASTGNDAHKNVTVKSQQTGDNVPLKSKWEKAFTAATGEKPAGDKKTLKNPAPGDGGSGKTVPTDTDTGIIPLTALSFAGTVLQNQTICIDVTETLAEGSPSIAEDWTGEKAAPANTLPQAAAPPEGETITGEKSGGKHTAKALFEVKHFFAGQIEGDLKSNGDANAAQPQGQRAAAAELQGQPDLGRTQAGGADDAPDIKPAEPDPAAAQRSKQPAEFAAAAARETKNPAVNGAAPVTEEIFTPVRTVAANTAAQPSGQEPHAQDDLPQNFNALHMPGAARDVPQPGFRTAENPQPLKEQIMQQIVQKATLFSSGTQQEMQIQLKPAHLGLLSMQILVENGAVTAKFQTDNPQVKGLLEASMQQLRQDLQAQGLKVQQVSVYLGHAGMSFADFSRREPQYGAVKVRRPEKEEHDDPITELWQTVNPADRYEGLQTTAVDYRA